MAKGSSVFAAVLLIAEVAGEYRRAVARPRCGRAAGMCDADDAAPMGNHQRHEHMESRMQWKLHVRFGGRGGETYQPKT